MPFLNLVPATAILLANCLTVCVSRKKFGRVLPLTLMLTVYALYISQFIGNTFLYGLIAIGLAAAGGAVAVGISVIKHRNGDLLLSNGFWISLVIFVLFFLLDYSRRLTQWDELMHWGKMVKQMLRLDRFYFVPESTLMRHKDYPPFMALFQVFWCRLSGGYSEMGVLMAIHVFEMSIVVPFLFEESEMGKTLWKRIFRGALFVLLYMVGIHFLDPSDTFTTIYTDILVGLMFAYSMDLVHSGEALQDGWGFAAYALSLVSLISIKQIGLAFMGVSFFYFALTVFGRKEQPAGRKILWIVLPPVLCAAVYWLWSRAVASYGIVGQFDLGSIRLDEILGYLKGSGSQHDMIVRFYLAVFNRTIISGIIPVTFVSSILVVIVLTELIYYKNGALFPRKDKNLIELSLVLGSLGYAAAMLVLYLFCFDTSEREILNSFPRYMGSWFTGEVVFLSFVACRVFRKRIDKQSNKRILLTLFTAMILLVPSNIKKVLPHFISENPMRDYKAMADTITEKTEEGARVYLAYNRSFGDSEQVFISYFTDDVYIDNAFVDVLNIRPQNREKTIEEAIEVLKGNDYLFTVSVTDSFNEAFSKYNDDRKFEGHQVYAISFKNGELHLSPVP